MLPCTCLPPTCCTRVVAPGCALGSWSRRSRVHALPTTSLASCQSLASQSCATLRAHTDRPACPRTFLAALAAGACLTRCPHPELQHPGQGAATTVHFRWNGRRSFWDQLLAFIVCISCISPLCVPCQQACTALPVSSSLCLGAVCYAASPAVSARVAHQC